MNFVYNITFDKNDLNKASCPQVLGYSVQSLLGLTGIYSVYKFQELPEDVIYISGTYPNVILNIETKAVALAIRINIKTKKVIVISFKTNPNKKGIGASILCSQINNTYRSGLEIITCQALRTTMHNGYITWGKFGFTIEEMYLSKYYNLLIQNGIERQELFQLLISHEDFWEKNGFTWDGKFDLSRESKNRPLLEEYIRKKILKSQQKQRHLKEAAIAHIKPGGPRSDLRTYQKSLYNEQLKEETLKFQLELIQEV